MIRPHGFTPNPQTAVDNRFQHAAPTDTTQAVARAAYDEVTSAAAALEAQGVTVHLFEGRGEKETPDSVCPNNWFSTHAGGHVALYPMYAPNRRRERRQDVIEILKEQYRVQDVIDYSGLEPDGLFLEGTGAMVLDHIARVACAATGGVVGIDGIGSFLGQNDNSSETFARHVDHVVQLVGPWHVALGLNCVFDTQELGDYMGKMGHTFPAELGYQKGMPMVEPEQLEAIVQTLMSWGYRNADLKALLGGNLMRLARQVWKPSQAKGGARR